MKEKNKKRQITKITVFITSIFVIFMSVTYAFITQVLTGEKQVVVSAGVLDLVLEEENAITISNSLPMYDAVGMIQEDVFVFRLVNNGSAPVNYKLKLVDVTPQTMERKCSDYGEITLDAPAECRKTIYPDELRQEALSICQQIDSSITTESQCLATMQSNSLPYKTFEEFIDAGVEYGVFEDTRVLLETYPDNYATIDFPRLATSYVKYGLTKDGETQIALLSSLTNGVIDSGTIDGNQTTYNYELRLWIRDTVTNNSSIEGRSLSFKIAVEIEQQVEYATAKNVNEVLDTSIDMHCTTYNDGVDTFLVGQCSQNYVWYSGKLWRVVLKNNETGAVKMVTDNAITSIVYTAEGKSAFENSYADQWLNQEFLPTLHDYEDYLVVDSIWDATEDGSDTPSRPNGTTTVTRTVGLLNSYEYYTTYANSNGLATNLTGYLNNESSWVLITPYSTSYTRMVRKNSTLTYTDNHPASGTAIRPSVNLKSTIEIDSGSGSKSNPYILKGDNQETVAGTTLLSTRYSGEYITFNNELYRIVNVEDGLTKITAVDKPSSLTSNIFDSNSSTNFANASIKTDLENYYQGLDSTWKDMIEPNTTWYLGNVAYSTHGCYKTSICATVDANTSTLDCIKITDDAKLATASIALPRIGEMFTSLITRGTKDGFWTLTAYSWLSEWMVYNNGGATATKYLSRDSYGARPSMYLKSNVVIAGDNTGNGTYEHPYSVELGS